MQRCFAAFGIKRNVGAFPGVWLSSLTKIGFRPSIVNQKWGRVNNSRPRQAAKEEADGFPIVRYSLVGGGRMSLTQAAIISSLSIALILAALFAALYAVERGRNLGMWSLAWFVYAFRFLFEILEIGHPERPFFMIARQFAMLLSTGVIILAAYRVVNRPAGLPRVIVGVSLLLFFGFSIGMGFGSPAVTVGLFLFTGAVLLWLGASFLLWMRHSPLGRPITGLALVVWGLHKLDFPLLSPSPDILPWGYFIASFLNLVVAIGLLIHFYENMRSVLVEREARYRGVFNNHHTIMLLVDPSTGMIVDANDAAATFYGYSVDQLKRMTFFQLTASSHDEATERTNASLSGRPGPYLSKHILSGGLFRDVEVFGGPVYLGERTYLCAVVHDVSDRIEFEESIRMSEEKFRMIFNNTGDAIFVHDFDGNMLETNRVACERLGYDPEEMQNIHLRDILEPGIFDRNGLTMMQTVREQGHFAFESVHVARDGRRIPTEVNSSMIEYSGKEAFLSVARDITERNIMENKLRQSLKEKEVLIKEIHHRVKNNLQIIDSLLRLQSRYVFDPADAGLFRMSENRVHTMALIHEQLYQSPNLSDIEMRSYLSRLISHLRSAFSTEDQGVELDEEIADVLLDIEVASPCALVVNELVTNCLKHAFTGRRKGKISVKLAETREGEELSLEVSDDGIGGMPSSVYEEPATLGYLLVRNLADQMAATLSVRSDESGTSVYLRLPSRPRSGDDSAEE